MISFLLADLPQTVVARVNIKIYQYSFYHVAISSFYIDYLYFDFIIYILYIEKTKTNKSEKIEMTN